MGDRKARGRLLWLQLASSGARDLLATGPLPCGPGPLVPGADRLVGKQRVGGEGRAARVLWPLSVTPHLPLHAACQEPSLAERSRGFTCPPPLYLSLCSPSAPFLPPLPVLPGRPLRITAFPYGPPTCGEGPEPPSLARWAQADALGLPKAKDLGRVGPDGTMHGACPSSGAGAPGHGGPAGRGQLALTLRERLIFSD